MPLPVTADNLNNLLGMVFSSAELATLDYVSGTTHWVPNSPSNTPVLDSLTADPVTNPYEATNVIFRVTSVVAASSPLGLFDQITLTENVDGTPVSEIGYYVDGFSTDSLLLGASPFTNGLVGLSIVENQTASLSGNLFALSTHDLINLSPESGNLSIPVNFSLNDTFFVPAKVKEALSDFNGDCESDILLQNSSTGQATLWLMDGTTRLAGTQIGSAPGAGLKIMGTGDFNGDGKADILWQNTATGQASIWLMNGASHVGGGAIGAAPGANVKVIATGDFNDDGMSDIVWQNTSTGQVSVWFMNGTSRIGGGTIGAAPGAGWSLAGVGDFNGDGDSDLVWQNATTGQAQIWLMNGAAKLAASGNAGSALGAAWTVAGVGDFNGDGNSDLVWQNTGTGQVSIWYMDGTTRTGGGSVGKIASAWVAAGTGDYNGDGDADILWQNSNTGQFSVWLMDGFTRLSGSGAVTPRPSTAWHAVA